MTQPSIGRIVHYQFMGQCVAALVTGQADDAIHLDVFPPPNIALTRTQPVVSEGTEDGTWHWPERA